LFQPALRPQGVQEIQYFPPNQWRQEIQMFQAIQLIPVTLTNRCFHQYLLLQENPVIQQLLLHLVIQLVQMVQQLLEIHWHLDHLQLHQYPSLQ